MLMQRDCNLDGPLARYVVVVSFLSDGTKCISRTSSSLGSADMLTNLDINSAISQIRLNLKGNATVSIRSIDILVRFDGSKGDVSVIFAWRMAWLELVVPTKPCLVCEQPIILHYRPPYLVRIRCGC